jgi:hypothetical protein
VSDPHALCSISDLATQSTGPVMRVLIVERIEKGQAGRGVALSRKITKIIEPRRYALSKYTSSS